jgi:hypothetical protein
MADADVAKAVDHTESGQDAIGYDQIFKQGHR